MTHVTKLVGAPGSGKTTKLLEFAGQEADDHGTSLNGLMFLTFTRSARNEATQRMMGVYDEEDEDDIQKRVRTLHGAALSQCLEEGIFEYRNGDLEEDGQLLIRKTNDDDAEYFEYFFKTEYPHIEYDTDERDLIEELRSGEPAGVATGNRVMALYDYVRSKAWPLEDYYRAPIDVELPPSETLSILQDWEDFKDRHDLIQDDDYVHLALEHGVAPPARVLIIDEFQDLSPLQYQLYEQWRDSGSVDRMYIAGDAHQAIYGFRGAEPAHFQETPADETIFHEESKRCPEGVIHAAVPIAAPAPQHDVSRVTAMRDGGSVDHVNAPDPDALGRVVQDALEEHDEVYLLTRTNRQTAKLAWGLRDAGVPYLDLKPNGSLRRWRDPMPTLFATLRSFDAEDDIPWPVAGTLLANVTDAPERHDAVQHARKGTFVAYSHTAGSGSTLPFETYRQWFPNVDSARDLVTELTLEDWQRDLLLGALESRVESHPHDVRIGTIHASKGLEAPCVLLFPAYSQRQLERFQGDYEAEERRLYYVAMTRSSEHIRIVHDFFGGEEFPPLAR